MAGAHDLDGLVIDQPQRVSRRFIGGEFRGIGAGRHLIYVDEGCLFEVRGQLARPLGQPMADQATAIRSGKWETGIWLRNSAQSRWDLVKVSGFKRWGVEFDPEFNAWPITTTISGRVRARLRQQ